MNIIKNGSLASIILDAIRNILDGVLITVIGFIGTLMASVLLFAINLKSWWRKMESKK
jgi:predicted CDP-diglyceride synthetase/phosphatidate cytidylyltransferase